MDGGTSATAGAIHVLHVDDDEALGDLASTYLERVEPHLDVTAVTSTTDALAHLAAHDVDCVVSDYDMPEMDGIEFLEAVREQYPELPFVLFTGKGSEEVASDAISAGVTDYLQKESSTEQYTVLAHRVTNAVERARAEQAAEQTRTQLQAVVENTADTILIVDGESTILFANPAAEELFGYTPGELDGESLTTLMPARYRDEHFHAVQRYLKTGERTSDWQSVEFPALHRDGHEIPVSISFGEFEQADEQRFIGVLRDVSERIRMEEQLREREERFRQVVENISEVVWLFDPDNEAAFYVNPAYEEVWGRSVESLYAEPMSFLDAVHPEDRERVEAALEERADGEYSEEYRVVRPDGEVRWVHDRAVPVEDDDGDVFRLVGVVSDITERRRQRENLLRVQDLLEKTERIADVGGWEIDTETMAVFWTDYLFDLLGVDYDEEPALDGALDVYHEDDRPIVEGAVEAALDSGESFDVEVRFRRPDGEVRWLRVKGVPTIENGDVVTLRGAVQDVTEQRRYRHQLERQNARLDQFASVVSHDLRNPLNVAAGHLELLSPDREDEHYDAIAHALDRMDRIVEDMLWLAREGKDIDATEPVDLRTAAEDAWQAVVGAADDSELVVADGLNTVDADYDRLCQLLENLFRNSVEHGADDGSVTVTVGSLADADGFYVADNGPGIPEAERESVFEESYSTSGTGFGLSIVEQIADAHDWDVRVAEGAAGGARIEIAKRE